MNLRVLAVLLAAAGLSAQSSVEENLRRGQEYATRYVPRSATPENREVARLATSAFEAVLAADSNNATAIRMLARLGFLQAESEQRPVEKSRRLEEADRWYRRLAAVNPSDPEGPYGLGAIAWAKAYPDIFQARQRAGMKPQEPGPLKDEAARNELVARHGATVHEGIRQLEAALALDPKYANAMAYMNLLLRLRGDLSTSSEEYRRDMVAADDWVKKALALRPAAETKPEAGGGAARIRVGPVVQERKLIHAPAPRYPPQALQARIQGIVRFNAVIGEDGTVREIQLVSGHPLLVEPAREVAAQYRYEPTLLNGKPVEVITNIDVRFHL